MYQEENGYVGSIRLRLLSGNESTVFVDDVAKSSIFCHFERMREILTC